MRRCVGVLLMLAFMAGGMVPGAVLAHGYKLGDISIGHIWAPPPQPGATGLPVYGPLLNGGAAPVRLVGASSPIAARTRFRIVKDGETRWLDSLALAPGKPLGLAAWRQHIWLSGLKRRLKPGDSFALTLDFGTAGRVSVEVVVQAAAGH